MALVLVFETKSESERESVSWVTLGLQLYDLLELLSQLDLGNEGRGDTDTATRACGRIGWEP